MFQELRQLFLAWLVLGAVVVATLFATKTGDEFSRVWVSLWLTGGFAATLLLRLKGPTVSHHLSKLRELGLVQMRAEGTTHLYRLDVRTLQQLGKRLFAGEAIASLADDVNAEAWERKVLEDFFEGERLKGIPASRKKREVVLRWLAGRFETERRYPESLVNEVIGRHHPDFATLRRELVGLKLMAREHGLYWRVPAAAP